MNEKTLATIAIIAGIINFVGLMPYIVDIFKRKTKPERAMWWIYTFLFMLLFAAQLKAGASWLLVVTAVYVLTSAVIAILSLKYGYGSFHKRDFYSIALALAGVGLWLSTDNPLTAIILVIVIDAAGFWLTLVKTWYAPYSETLISWQAACVSAALSLVAVGSWKFELLVYPLYALLGTGLIVGIILYRRAHFTQNSFSS